MKYNHFCNIYNIIMLSFFSVDVVSVTSSTCRKEGEGNLNNQLYDKYYSQFKKINPTLCSVHTNLKRLTYMASVMRSPHKERGEERIDEKKYE